MEQDFGVGGIDERGNRQLDLGSSCSEYEYSTKVITGIS